jgi:hypothetical protein
MTLACIIAAVCILVAGLFAVIVERTTERDTAREAAERAGRERDAAEKAARIATELLAQREADARRAGLRSVPAQRDAEHDHLAADDDWFARLYDDKGNLR